MGIDCFFVLTGPFTGPYATDSVGQILKPAFRDTLNLFNKCQLQLVTHFTYLDFLQDDFSDFFRVVVSIRLQTCFLRNGGHGESLPARYE